MQSFADLGVSSAVVKALANEGVHEPFAVQRLVISDILAGRDVLARSPTGSGKTLAFGIPLVDRIASDGRRPAALILAPTRELATQIAADIRGIAHARALAVTAVYGGVGLVKQAKEAARSHDPGGNARAPGGPAGAPSVHAGPHPDARPRRGRPHARHGLSARGGPDRARVPGAAPDAVLLGHAGRRGRRHGAALHHRPRAPRARAFGAPRRRRGGAPVRPGVTARGGIEALIAELEAERDLALVFVRTKRGADRLVKRLDARGVRAMAMHGNKSQRQREVALARFESGSIDTLVATDVAARGIDVSGISHVINFDPPARSRDLRAPRRAHRPRRPLRRRHHAGRPPRAARAGPDGRSPRHRARPRRRGPAGPRPTAQPVKHAVAHPAAPARRRRRRSGQPRQHERRGAR